MQGINDLVTPFMAVFMSEHLEGPMEGWSLEGCGEDLLLDIEADCYWSARVPAHPPACTTMAARSDRASSTA